MRRRPRADRGASAVEYAALIVLSAAVLAALSGVFAPVGPSVADAVERLFNPGAAPSDLAGTDPNAPPTDDGAAPAVSGPGSPPDLGGLAADFTSGLVNGLGASPTTPPDGGEPSLPTWDDYLDRLGRAFPAFVSGVGGAALDELESTIDMLTDPVGYVVDTTTAVYEQWQRHNSEYAPDAAARYAEGDYLGALWESAVGAADWHFVSAPWSAGGLASGLFNSIIDEEVRSGWTEAGCHRLGAGMTTEEVARCNEVIGRVGWNLGSYFIPGAGWITKPARLLDIISGTAPTTRGDDEPPSVAAPDNRPDERQDAGDAPQGEQHQDDRPGSACRTNSFVPGTPVLLADGSTTPIEDITVGDLVWAADPLTGEQGPREVTHLITGTGQKHLVSITVDTDGDGHGDQTITATDEHPFWLPEEQEWAEAGELRPDRLLQTSIGDHVRITETRQWMRPAQTVHNLTITDLHTYHVGPAREAVLVHNAAAECPTDEPESPSSARPTPSTAAPIQVGEPYYHRIETEHGAMEIIAETSADGTTLHFSDLALYPADSRELGRGDLGVAGAARLLREIRQVIGPQAARQGFTEIRVTAVRATGNVGHQVDFTIPIQH
ncbi:polymorphic toxin-type HINT domain-containing protein [Allonocardiopsis opalescens]|uniref:Intein n=1 Tax=Allonocardiopsis opalescens TaxID=1144618 RepID=A0A2T0PU32_9ACTN|nr:polymorphic toxin-type HINT domain-containing protein [Allonocardiopsis opalescens]PRX92409.1 intein [Allonocardiopsis opalescens]